jgi:MraZ protein
MERWEKEVDQVTSRSRSTQRNRNYARSFFGGASDQQLDKQGRLVVPANLREYAGIDRDGVILGVGDHLEVWAADAWDTLSSAADQSFSDLEEDESWDGK